MNSTPTPAAGGPPVAGQMTHRQILNALSGLLLAMFVAILSSTVVSAALPEIIADLKGGQSAYTWVVTATLLTMTISTPIWGKMSDLFNRKQLIQLGLVIYLTGSILAGFATSTTWLIACRAIQGVGVGALTALVQVILSDLVSPRERGRYMGYLGAVFGLGTVAGPVIGGLLTDGLGWRYCFFVGVPFALFALVLLQRTLRLPTKKRDDVHIDVIGGTFMAAGVASLLIWVSLAGKNFDWMSWQTAAMVIGGIVLLFAAVMVERRAPEPLVPLDLFENRTVVMAVIASVAVGVAMFGTTLFLTQYMQLARGYSPTASGLLTIPMVVGLFGSSTLSGRRISQTGHYKRFMLAGTVALTVGLALMGTIDEKTSLVEVGIFMFVLGAGIGMVMQNLILAVQNVIPVDKIGAGSALIAFFRSLGGAIGVSVLGAILGSKVASTTADGLAEQGIPSAGAPSGGSIPDVGALPGPVREIVEHAYGTGVAEIFLIAAPLGVVAFIAVWFLREKALGTKSGIELAAEQAQDGAASDEPEAPRRAPELREPVIH
ncbi:MDR family MFS transporter [Patulibacter sp.]|uniref:MDR family MFS transporter n=1 Tax=Patulibacter sp. TaxID=1912859 RepID=UPI002718C98E|nr:MDR family MFS transporter [Patulibacter sp.]MDO9410290.1 MDR family MFS transporter [Patulibacter sp.]